MGRGKLALELIPKEKARRITYEKRKKGLMKKAQEFTTLCGVDTCMVIYGPAGSTATTEPEVWPASPEKVKLVIERYRSEGADRRAKRTIGLPEFFANRKRKVDAELAKARLANWEAKYPVSEALIEGFSEEDLRRLLGSLGHKLEVAKARLAVMKEDAMRRSSSHVYDHHIHANDHVYHPHHMQGMFQDHIMPVPMKQSPTDVKPHLDLPYHMMQQQQQQPLFEPDCLNSSIPMPSEWWAQKNQYLNHIPPVPSGCSGTTLVNNFHHSVSFPTMQNYQFATLEGMMLSEMSAYGPIKGNTSLGGTASSSAACYNNTQLVQPAPPPVPLSVMRGDPIPTQMKQASTQFHEYR
ncbi:MADS-box transcription factor 56 [Eucalyptus grandis]|uniref:MADS-box transcription factor 56 n=1 Tax=Eucalyptus grandis TaxID=71139 RepID=UPI00192EE79A|nr:MADS-box transcription factor 56 [Eucalyptus grandis]